MREVTPISNYKLKLFGRELSVCPTGGGDLPFAELLTDEIYISADPDPDVFLTVRAAPGVASPLTLALVAGHHLLCRRGLPLAEVAVNVGGSTVDVVATDDGRIGVPIRIRRPCVRCTEVLYSTELPLLVYPSSLGNIILVHCTCSEHFEESALMSIWGKRCIDAAGCVAFSYTDGDITARAYSPIFSPVCSVPELGELLYSYALTELGLYGAPPFITCSDVNVPVVVSNGRALVCTDR